MWAVQRTPKYWQRSFRNINVRLNHYSRQRKLGVSWVCKVIIITTLQCASANSDSGSEAKRLSQSSQRVPWLWALGLGRHSELITPGMLDMHTHNSSTAYGRCTPILTCEVIRIVTLRFITSDMTCEARGVIKRRRKVWTLFCTVYPSTKCGLYYLSQDSQPCKFGSCRFGYPAVQWFPHRLVAARRLHPCLPSSMPQAFWADKMATGRKLMDVIMRR